MDAYLSAAGYASIADVPVDSLTVLVNYHIQLGRAKAEEIVSNYYASPSQGGYGGTYLALFVEQLVSGLFFNGQETIEVDIEASNGIIHVLDGVLVPPTAYDLLVQNGSFSIAVEALEKAELTPLLTNADPYTFFAPSNMSFETFISDSEFNSISEIPKDSLEQILKLHMVPGNIPTEELLSPGVLTPLSGEDLEITSGIGGLSK